MDIECKPLENILEFLKILNEDVVSIIPSEEGWEFYARDPSNCSMGKMLLKKEAFTKKYEVWDPFAIDLDRLSSMITKRDKVGMTKGDGFVTITYEKSRNKCPLKILDERPRLMPKIELVSSVAVTSDHLADLAKEKFYAEASGAEHGLKIEITETELTMSYDAHDGSYRNSIDTIMSDLPEGEQYAYFDSRLLLPLLKALPPALPLVFAMDTNKPVKISFNAELYSVVLFVAPRIED